MSASLPHRPHLDWYRKSAKKKLGELRLKSPAAKLADAQLAIAREKGFASWRKLVSAIDAKAADSPPDLDVFFRNVARAVVRRDVNAVRSAIGEIPQILNYNGPHPNWGGKPQLLHVAIETGEEPIARLLLDSGADPSGQNDPYGGWSPLLLAVLWKRNAIRDLLIDRGAHVGLYEALMLGDERRALELIKTLDPEKRGPSEATPLHFAGTVKVAQRLIDCGVDVAARDKYGNTPLDAAATRNDHAVARLLQKRGLVASVETCAKLGDLAGLQKALGRKKPTVSLFKPAIEGGQIKIMRWLIEQGVDVNEPDDKGITPLHMAAWEGNLSAARLLVRAGADVHAEDEQYSATPAGWAQHAAQNFNRVACVAVTGYLQKQADKTWSVKNLPVHRQTHKITRWKPIMDAAFDGDSARIRKLIQAGADPNAVSTTPGAHRPLHRAIEEKETAPRGVKHESAVKALLAGGADPLQRGGYERLTALQLAALDSPRFVPLLIHLFKPLDFFHACAVLDLQRVQALLKNDKRLAVVSDENGFSALHYVAGSRMDRQSPKLAANQLAIARQLIDAGAEVNATCVWAGSGGWPMPVLYMSCGRNDNAAMTELLMQAGARPYDDESVYHASDEQHIACLAIIEKYADKTLLAQECTKCLRTQMHWGRSRGAKWLLEHGADPNSLHPQFGNSALHQAALLGSSDRVLALLLQHGGNPNVKNAQGKSAIKLAEETRKDRVVQCLRQSVENV